MLTCTPACCLQKIWKVVPRSGNWVAQENISNPFFNVLASHCVNLLGVLCVILTVQIHVKHWSIKKLAYFAKLIALHCLKQPLSLDHFSLRSHIRLLFVCRWWSVHWSDLIAADFTLENVLWIKWFEVLNLIGWWIEYFSSTTYHLTFCFTN